MIQQQHLVWNYFSKSEMIRNDATHYNWIFIMQRKNNKYCLWKYYIHFENVLTVIGNRWWLCSYKNVHVMKILILKF